MTGLVVFDLGETLVSYQGVPLNWSAHYSGAVSSALETLNLPSTDDQLSMAIAILDFYNTRTSPRLFEVAEGEVLSKVARVFGASSTKFETSFFHYFQRLAVSEPSAHKTLDKLKSADFKMAVLSDVPYGMPRDLLRNDLGELNDLFDNVFSSCEVGFRKPHPQGLHKLMELHGASANTTAFVGNEAKDIECAENAGVTAVLLDPTGEKQFGQDYSIKSLSELLTILL